MRDPAEEVSNPTVFLGFMLYFFFSSSIFRQPLPRQSMIALDKIPTSTLFLMIITIDATHIYPWRNERR